MFGSYHSLLAAEGSFPDMDQTAILAEVEASDGEADLVAADLAKVAQGQGCLDQGGLP